MITDKEKKNRLYEEFYRAIKSLEKRRGNDHRLTPISPAGCDREFAVNVWCWIHETEKSLELIRRSEMRKMKCDACGKITNMDEAKEVMSVHDWCSGCSHIRKDADYCMTCIDRSLENIVIPEPRGYKKVE